MPEKKKLVLIDGHALAYRAFHALSHRLIFTNTHKPEAVAKCKNRFF